MNRRIVQCKSVCPICGQSEYVGRNYIRHCKHCDIYIDGLDVPVDAFALPVDYETPIHDPQTNLRLTDDPQQEEE